MNKYQQKEIPVRHRIIKFTANSDQTKLERAECVCEFEGTMDEVMSHIQRMQKQN